MQDLKITFFMLVTDRDIIMADYAIKSYAKVKNISFKLYVYSNWINSELKQKYFPDWRKFEFVEIIENDWQTDDKKPTDRRLEGPFEKCGTIWDRELKKIQTPYFATVDADFEILDAKFISVMLSELDANPNWVAMSTDYNPRLPEYYDAFSKEVICLNERWHTCFCIYKREALQCTVSHLQYEEIISDSGQRNVWDETGYFQKALREIYGFEIKVLDSKYQPCFIHYGAFSKNVNIDETNIVLYRQLQILRKRGLFGALNKIGLLGICDILTRRVATLVNKIIFGQIFRGKYVDGWGVAESGS